MDDGDGGTDTGSTVVTVLAPTIEDVIAAVNAAAADGTLVGDGPGRSGVGRLGAWRNMLNAAQNALNGGNAAGACSQLGEAHLRVDGAAPPPDFVTGAARGPSRSGRPSSAQTDPRGVVLAFQHGGRGSARP